MLRALYSEGVGGQETVVSRQMDFWRALAKLVETTLLTTVWIKVITSCPPYTCEFFLNFIFLLILDPQAQYLG